MKHTHNSLLVSKVLSDILSIPFASLVPFPLLNPNWSSPSTSSVFLSVLLLIILSTIYAVCTMRLIVRCALHFAACGFFFKAIIVTAVKSLGHPPVSCMLLISRVISLRPSFPNILEYIPRYIIIPCNLLIPCLDSFSCFTLQNIGTFLICTYFLFRYDFEVCLLTTCFSADLTS